MKKFVSLFAATAMTIGLTSSVSEYELKFTSSETEIVTDIYTNLKQYWIARGIGIEATKLVLLDEHDKADCDVRGNQPRGTYCIDEKEVVITVAAMKILKNVPEGVETAATFLVAHELGHAVQDANHLINQSQSQYNVELQANCLAGFAMNAVYPDRAAIYNVPAYNATTTMGRFLQFGVSGVDCFTFVPPMKG